MPQGVQARDARAARDLVGVALSSRPMHTDPRPLVPARRRAPALLLALALAAGTASAQEDVPFITTPDNVTLAMLELAGVGAGDHVIDLGSGDGRIVITAARRFGASGLGVEIVPDLVLRSRVNARAAGVAERVEFREQDLFTTPLGRATVVTMYLLPEVNLQLRPRLAALQPGTRIVSHDWDLGDWTPDRSITVAAPDKTIGRDKSSRLMLWVVPAQVHGLWCTAGASLAITQRFQAVSGEFRLAAPGGAAGPTTTMVFDARVAGRAITVQAPHAGMLQADADSLRVHSANGALAAFMGQPFRRATGSRCP